MFSAVNRRCHRVSRRDRLWFPVAFYDQPDSAVQEGPVFREWQRFLVHDRIVGSGAGQFHDGKEHDIHIPVIIIIVCHQFQEALIDLIVILFPGKQCGAQCSHYEILRNEVQKGLIFL